MAELARSEFERSLGGGGIFDFHFLFVFFCIVVLYNPKEGLCVGFFGTPLMQIGVFCFLGCIHPQIIDALKFKVQTSKFIRI